MSDEKKDLPELSKDGQKILDLVKTLTVLDLAAVVKHMEEEFGVSASAPAAVMVAGDAGGAEAAEQTEFDVILEEIGGSKIGVIKAVREATGLGLKEAKGVVDATPGPVKEGISKDEAEALQAKLSEAGATASIK